MKHLLALALLVIVSCTALAQTPPAPPKPGPEQQKLNYFAGTWTSTGESKPSVFGPGGKFTFTDRSEWFPGGFFLITHSDGEIAGLGKMKGLAAMGYDNENKVYTYQAVDSMGMQVTATGKNDGDTWNWTSEGTYGGKKMKQRYTVKTLSPTAYDFKFEASEDGMNWNTIMEGSAKKTGAAAKGAAAGAKSSTKTKTSSKGATTETTTTTTTKQTTKPK